MQHKNKRASTDVANYYDVVTAPYRAFWSDYFHPAIFDDPHDDFPTALKKTHQQYIRGARINPGDFVIDLGCGIGAFSCLVARQCRCRVLGITISDYQIKLAKRFAKKQGLKEVMFKKMDIMDIDDLPEKFNAGFLIDAGCHLPDKAGALKANGRLVIADWLQKENPSMLERELLIEPFNRYWHFPYMESLNGYRKLLKRAGLRIICAEDISEKMKKNWDAFYDLAIQQVGRMDLKKIVRCIANPAAFRRPRLAFATAKNQFYANTFVKTCYEAGVFRYGYFVCKKT